MPSIVLAPTVYANRLRERTAQHNVKVWLVSTGWRCGPGGVGERMPTIYTLAIDRSTLGGALVARAIQFTGRGLGRRSSGRQYTCWCPGAPPSKLNQVVNESEEGIETAGFNPIFSR